MNRRNGNWLARFINQLTATAATVRAALSGYPSIKALRRRAKAPPAVQPFGLAIKFLFGLWQLLDVAGGVLSVTICRPRGRTVGSSSYSRFQDIETPLPIAMPSAIQLLIATNLR
jgi:hypothetical protein